MTYCIIHLYIEVDLRWRDYGSKTKFFESICISRYKTCDCFFSIFFWYLLSARAGNGILSTATIMRFSLECRRDRPPEDRARRCIAPTTSSRGNGIRSLACRGSEIQLVSCAEASYGYREIREGVSFLPLSFAKWNRGRRRAKGGRDVW